MLQRMDTKRRHPKTKASRSKNPGLAVALKLVGGQAPLSRLIGRTQPSVHRWTIVGTPVSAEDAVKIEQATGVPAESINPALAEFARMRGLPVREAKAA